jgi:hypothetical protein
MPWRPEVYSSHADWTARQVRASTPVVLTSLRGYVAGAGLVERACWLLIAIAIAMVGFFDLQSNVTIVDEYARRWTIQQLVAGRGIQLWGTSPNMVQNILAIIPAQFGLEPRFWRLVGLPFLLLEAIFTGLVAVRLGANRTWATIAAATVVCNPLNLSVATGMQTDIVFLGLFIPGIWLAIRWVMDGKGRIWFVVVATVATAQRQQGVFLVPVVLLGLILMSRNRRPTLRDGLAVLIAGAATYGELQFVQFLGRHTSVTTAGAVGPAVPHTQNLAFVIYALASVGPILGLFGLPLAGAALLARRRPDVSWRSTATVAVSVGLVGLLVGWYIAVGGRGLFPGNYLYAGGLGPVHLAGPKPPVLGASAYFALEVLATVAFLIFLLMRRADWDLRALGIPGVMAAAAASMILASFYAEGQALDRYYVAISALLIPIVAAAVSGAEIRPAISRGWALGSIVALILFYVAAEQDFISILKASELAAEKAYAQVDHPWQVEAGFEIDASHVFVPAIEHPGEGLQGNIDNPARLELQFAGVDDPRPGVTYDSSASGKIVIVAGQLRR